MSDDFMARDNGTELVKFVSSANRCGCDEIAIVLASLNHDARSSSQFMSIRKEKNLQASS